MADLGRRVFLSLSILAALAAAPAASAAPGQLDPSFGNGGVVKILPSEETIAARAVANQPDGKIVLAGGEDPGSIFVVRLLSNGAFDPGFGQGGKVVTAFPGGFGEARSVAIQPDGKIVVAGAAAIGAAKSDFVFVRYNADGSPDPSFGGGDGVELVPVSAEEDRAEAVAIAANGRIVATGESGMPPNGRGAGVAVLLPNGTPDPSFAADGSTVVTTPSEEQDTGEQAALLADGRVVVASSTGKGAGDGFTLVRLLPAGGLDPSFGGGDGIVETPIPVGASMTGSGRVTDFVLLGDGRIVASGYSYDLVGPALTNDDKVAVVAYLPDGELDKGFGTEGIFAPQPAPGDENGWTIDADSAGRFVLAGSYTAGPDGDAPALLRLGPGGALDPSFGAGGIVLRGPTAPFGEYVYDAGLDPFDRVVTVGRAYIGGGNTEVVVTRYGDPRPEVLAAANRAPRVRMKKVPKKVAAEKLTGFSGTASDPDGDALRGVQIALVKLVRGGAKASARGVVLSCLVLKNHRSRFRQVRVKRGNRCPQRWLAAKGKAKWSFRLKKSLPAGRYVVYARAVDARGLAGATFSRKLGNRYAFRVLAD